MIIYKKEWLDALQVQEQAGKWLRKGLLSQQQWQQVQAQFNTGFYTPNIFVRIGLFVFCWILVSSVFGLTGAALIAAMPDSEEGAGIIILLFGLVLLGSLEYFVRDKKYCRAGIDDALLYMATGLIITGLSLCLDSVLNNYLTSYFLLALPFLIMGAIRYTDRFLTVVAYACAFIILFLVSEANDSTRTIIPFISMLFSALVYGWVRNSQKREEWRFWNGCLQVLKGCSLITFYLSSNYFVVKELGEELFTGFIVSLPFIFFATTALIPLLYLYAGLKYKDRLLLRIGLVMVAISVITFKYYFSLGHHEITLTLAGAVMVALAYVSIRYLKKPAFGLTYQEDLSEETTSYMNAEALIVAQTLGNNPVVAGKEFGFGGGKFGGGGAGGNY